MRANHSPASITRRGRQFVVAVCLGFTAACWSGCSTANPAVVTTDAIKNPTVGLRGYQLTIPPGFKVVEAKDAAGSDHPLVVAGSRLWKSLVERETGAMKHLRFSENYHLYNHNSAFRFFVGIHNSPEQALHPGEAERNLKRSLSAAVERLVKRLEQGGAQGVRAQRLKEGEGRLGMTIEVDAMPVPMAQGQTCCLDTWALLGNLNEIYILFGIADAKNAAAMRSDLRALVHNLRF